LGRDFLQAELSMRPHQSLDLSAQEIQRAFADPKWASAFPPVLTPEEAAELIRVPLATIYDWSSRELLANCAVRAGKRLKIWRDRLIIQVFNHGIKNDK
jgi:hypothetical protein